MRLVGARVLGGPSFDEVAELDVVIDGGRIAATEPWSRNRRRDDVDLSGLTLLPGLIDAHTHLGIVDDFTQQSGSVSTAELAARVFDNLRSAVDAGVTTVRELGGLDGGIQEPISRGYVPAPRVLPSGPALCQHGGAGSLVPPYATQWVERGVVGLTQPTVMCDGPDACRRAARAAFRNGATQLKVCLSGGVISTTDCITDTQFSHDELRVLVEEATARRTYVTAHAHNVDAIRLGLRAGVRCFEHASLLDDETAAELKAAGAAIVATLSVVDVLHECPDQSQLPRGAAARLGDIGARMKDAITRAVDAGVTVGCGSDLVGPQQTARAGEVSRLAEIVGPAAAVRAATAVNAHILRMGGELGRVATDYRADLIAVEGNPLEEPELFRDPARVVLVMRDGLVLKDSRLRRSSNA